MTITICPTIVSFINIQRRSLELQDHIFYDPLFLDPVIHEHGRTMKSEVRCSEFSLIFYKFHNYGIANVNSLLFKIDLNRDISSSVETNSFSFLCGDFNVAKEGLSDIDHHFPLATTSSRSNYRILPSLLMKFFSL